jgi:hypothetical protein
MADGNRDGNRGELWRTLANVGGRKTSDLYTGRTLANYGELKNGVLKTTWVRWVTGFISLPLYQTYLRRTGGICAPESARGRQNFRRVQPALPLALSQLQPAVPIVQGRP